MDDDYKKPIAMNIDASSDGMSSTSRTSLRNGPTGRFGNGAVPKSSRAKPNNNKQHTNSNNSKFTGTKPKPSKTAKPEDKPADKRISFQHLHSNYTKRRYSHVQSKIGPYIAQMEAEEAKRVAERKAQRERNSRPIPPKPVVDLTRAMTTEDYLALIRTMQKHIEEVETENGYIEQVIADSVRLNKHYEEHMETLHEDMRECKERTAYQAVRRQLLAEMKEPNRQGPPFDEERFWRIVSELEATQDDTNAEMPPTKAIVTSTTTTTTITTTATTTTTTTTSFNEVKLEDVDEDEAIEYTSGGSTSYISLPQNSPTDSSESAENIDDWYTITRLDKESN